MRLVHLTQALAILGVVSLWVFAGAWALVEWGIRRQAARVINAAARFSEGDFGARIGKPYPSGELGGLMSSLDHAFDLLQTQREKIERLTRVYAVLSGINGFIVRVRYRDELFREVCQIAVQTGKFRMAWIGVVDQKAMRVMPVAWHGTGEDYIRLIPLQLGDPVSAGSGMTGQTVLERKAAVSDDLTQDPRILLRTEALV